MINDTDKNVMGPEKEKNYVSSVVYIHNSSHELPGFLSRLYKVFDSSFDNYEFIFVNDSSTDDSVELVREFFSRNRVDAVTILNMSYYQGVEKCMTAGTELSIGDYVFEFDLVSNSFASKLIMEVYHRCLEGFDIVSAYPISHNHRTSSLYYAIFNKFSYAQENLRTETFRILSRRSINRIYEMNTAMLYRKAAYASCGLPMDSIGYEPDGKYATIDGEQKKLRNRVGIDALILYTDVAYRFAMLFSILMIVFTIVCCVYIALVYAVGKPVPGYVSTFAIAAFGFFGVDILLTILIKYVSLNLKLLFQKKEYMIRSIEKI